MDYAAARRNMVDGQLRTNKVTNAAIQEAFGSVPRDRFVPEDKRGFAYIDEDLEIASGRYLMEPMVLARLLQSAQIGAADVVLDIGCGTGYSSAILARLAATVVALESESKLAARANELASELGNDNMVVVEGALTEGYPKQAPYNVILIAAAVGEVPAGIIDQLADGGRLLTVVRQGKGLGQASIFVRTGAGLSHRVLFDAATPYLPGLTPAPSFAF